jgi:hypothetical protein
MLCFNNCSCFGCCCREVEEIQLNHHSLNKINFNTRDATNEQTEKLMQQFEEMKQLILSLQTLNLVAQKAGHSANNSPVQAGVSMIINNYQKLETQDKPDYVALTPIVNNTKSDGLFADPMMDVPFFSSSKNSPSQNQPILITPRKKTRQSLGNSANVTPTPTHRQANRLNNHKMTGFESMQSMKKKAETLETESDRFMELGKTDEAFSKILEAVELRRKILTKASKLAPSSTPSITANTIEEEDIDMEELLTLHECLFKCADISRSLGKDSAILYYEEVLLQQETYKSKYPDHQTGMLTMVQTL